MWSARNIEAHLVSTIAKSTDVLFCNKSWFIVISHQVYVTLHNMV